MEQETTLFPEILKRIQTIQDADAFTNYSGIELDTVTPDHVRMKVTLQPHHQNPMGIPHGGVYFTLADDAAGMVAMTDGSDYVTQNADFRFIRYATGGTIYGDATAIHRGAHVCIVHVNVTDDAGRLLCDGTFNLFRV